MGIWSCNFIAACLKYVVDVKSKSSFFPGRWNNACFVLDVLDKNPWEKHDLYSFYNAILVLLIRCNIFFLWEKFISNNMLNSSEKIRNLKYSSPMDRCNNQPSKYQSRFIAKDGILYCWIYSFTNPLFQNCKSTWVEFLV
jgi:hypothetical protein